jgi:hypothetical protein
VSTSGGVRHDGRGTVAVGMVLLTLALIYAAQVAVPPYDGSSTMVLSAELGIR